MTTRQDRLARAVMFCVCLLLANVCLADRAAGQTSSHTDEREFHIPAEGVAAALATFAERAGVEIISADRDVEGAQSSAISGRYSPDAALESLLAGTGLTFSRSAYGVFVIKREMRAARSTLAPATRSRAAGASPPAFLKDASPSDEIVATGSHIGGAPKTAFPLRSFSREDMFDAGAATIQDYFRTLPMNLDLSETTAAGFAGPTAGLGGASAGVNLRGLGPSATLTLLNGRRVAEVSGGAGFADISLIPLSAVDRVDIMTDGASAIYGSDAVAGVVNFNLRDVDGAETRLRYGGVTDGGLRQFQASQALGKTWDGAAMSATYEYFKATRLDANDRDFASGAADPTDLLPARERHSVVATGSVSPARALNVATFALYSDSVARFHLSDDTFGADAERTDAQLFMGALEADLQMQAATRRRSQGFAPPAAFTSPRLRSY